MLRSYNLRIYLIKVDEDDDSEETHGKIALNKQGITFNQFQLNKAVVLFGKCLDPGTLSSYKDDLDISEDSKSDSRSSISEEETGVDEEDSEFILSANKEISLDTIVSTGTELARTFVLEDCVIFQLNVVTATFFLVEGVIRVS